MGDIPFWGEMTAGPVMNPAMGMRQAPLCMCPHWRPASRVFVVWLMLPDVRMHRPATALLFNRPLCKLHQTVVQVTWVASCGCDAECSLGFLFVWVCSPFVNSKECLPVKSSSCLLGWTGRGEEGQFLLPCCILHSAGAAASFWNLFEYLCSL